MISKMKEIIKNNRKKIIVISFIILLVIIGLSYAWLRTAFNGKKDVQIVVGDLDLILDESSTEGIQLTNVVPTYDDEGMTYEPYTFKLKNQSNIDIYYTLSLVDDEELISGCESDNGEVVVY